MWVNLLLLIRSILALSMQIGSLIKLNRTNYEDCVRSFLNCSVFIIILKLHKRKKFLMLSLLAILCMFKFVHFLILFLLLTC